jgi:hypothetical protein
MPRHPTRTGDAPTPGRLAFLSGALLLMIILGGCSTPRPPAPTETVRELSWSRIALPDLVAASSLTTTTGELLVGGRATSGGDHPVLFVVKAAGTASPVSLHPNSPYGKVADMVSVAVRGNQVAALGAAHGGAHANFRWTVWTGSKQGLDDHPQTFETSVAKALAVFSTSCSPPKGRSSPAAGPLGQAVWTPQSGCHAGNAGFGRALQAPRSQTRLRSRSPPAPQPPPARP